MKWNDCVWKWSEMIVHENIMKWPGIKMKWNENKIKCLCMKMKWLSMKMKWNDYV